MSGEYNSDVSRINTSPNQGSAARMASETKKKYIGLFASNQVTIEDLVTISKQDTDEGRYVSRIRLMMLISALDGWTKERSADALMSYDLSKTSTITTVRNSARRMNAFNSILAATARRHGGRPKAPAGWPWAGKVEDIIELGFQEKTHTFFKNKSVDPAPKSSAVSHGEGIEDISELFGAGDDTGTDSLEDLLGADEEDEDDGDVTDLGDLL